MIASHYLKRGLETMYNGNVIILGNPDIKPQDFVHMFDSYNDMTGSVRVKSVSHIYSPNSGYVTSVSVMPVVNMRDLHYNSLGYALTSI